MVRKFQKITALVTAIRMNQPCWVKYGRMIALFIDEILSGKALSINSDRENHAGLQAACSTRQSGVDETTLRTRPNLLANFDIFTLHERVNCVNRSDLPILRDLHFDGQTLFDG